MRQLDAHTIRNEPIASIDLMERAASACADWLDDHFTLNTRYIVFAGPGNNGGDGLAIARMASDAGGEVVVVVDPDVTGSEDYRANLKRIQHNRRLTIFEYGDFDWNVPEQALVIDALFGYGVNRPIEGLWSARIDKINALPNVVVSIDLPSGVIPDAVTKGPSIRADFTLTFQTPKLAFFIPENAEAVGEWIVLDIGLDVEFLEQLSSPWEVIGFSQIKDMIRQRGKFDHKGTFGHALLVAGSFGKVGAAILAAKACLRSGVGLLTVHAPRKACDILQITVPEAMVSADRHDFNFSGLDHIPEKVSAIGMGCGLGIHGCTTAGIRELFKQVAHPMVIDADGLNTLARNPELIDQMPPKTILTPHLKEFERVFSEAENHFERLDILRERCQARNVICVLKGAHSAVALPDGRVYFNMTGNPGMATAGSGDVLTGVITGVLAQGYQPEEAAILGVYIHGLAGDIACEGESEESLVASDIVSNLGRAFQHIHEQ